MKVSLYVALVAHAVLISLDALAADGPPPVAPMSGETRILPPAPASPLTEEVPESSAAAAPRPRSAEPTEPVTVTLPGQMDVPLPAVDRAIVRGKPGQNGPTPATSTPAGTGSGIEINADLKDLVKPAKIEVKPGVTEIVPIAVNLTNRIVTPFQKAVVRTVNDAIITVEDGGVIYLSTSKEKQPLSLFITEEGDESVAISLVLYPLDVPSREIQLTLPGVVAGRAPRPAAARWESSQPYIKTIRDAFRAVALGAVPQGYALEVTDPEVHNVPHCAFPSSLPVHFAQTLVGGRMNIFVGTVLNAAQQTLELREAACADADVVAVAFWPNVVLEPGAGTEVYVLRRKAPVAKSTTRRPFLAVGARQ